MKLHYSGFQGLQLGEVFGQGLGVVYGEAGISTCAGRPCKILQHILEVGILRVGLLPKLVFLSAGTCVVGTPGWPCSSTCGGVCLLGWFLLCLVWPNSASLSWVLVHLLV